MVEWKQIEGNYRALWLVLREIATETDDTELAERMDRLEQKWGDKWLVSTKETV